MQHTQSGGPSCVGGQARWQSLCYCSCRGVLEIQGGAGCACIAVHRAALRASALLRWQASGTQAPAWWQVQDIESVSQGPTSLCRYGITPDFKDFVRSLTYSTFRDFPSEELEELAKDAAVTGSTAPPLTPWQVRGCAQLFALTVAASLLVAELQPLLSTSTCLTHGGMQPQHWPELARCILGCADPCKTV